MVVSRRALSAAANATGAKAAPASAVSVEEEIKSLETLLAQAKARLPKKEDAGPAMADSDKFVIGTYNAISKTGLNEFPKNKYRIVPLEKNAGTEAHAILLRSHKLTNEQVPSSVRAIARCGSGTNNIPVEQMTNRGIPVFNTPGANANAVKELTICALLLASRGVVEGIEHTKKIFAEDGKEKEKVKKRIENEKKMFVGQEVKGKRLGVIGLGYIGASVAEVSRYYSWRYMIDRGTDPLVSKLGCAELGHVRHWIRPWSDCRDRLEAAWPHHAARHQADGAARGV